MKSASNGDRKPATGVTHTHTEPRRRQNGSSLRARPQDRARRTRSELRGGLGPTFDADNVVADLLAQDGVGDGLDEVVDGVDGGVDALEALDLLPDGLGVVPVGLGLVRRRPAVHFSGTGGRVPGGELLARFTVPPPCRR